MLSPFFRTIGLAALLVLLSACASAPTNPLTSAQAQSLLPERDLVGKSVGRGEFSAINGTARSFTAYLDGSWDGETLTLVEDFEYDDGQKDRKTWRLTKLPSGEYSGTREDVIGTARGYLDGPTFRLEYKIRLQNEDGEPGMTVTFKDVLALRPDDVIVNTATIGKWGFKVGEVNLTITPAPDS
ncbi:MAG: hypothetical protein CMK09_11800 [Ponticaulis sp.]|nr:hypothetical protein [Ponticaulis sp.]|tara:strand:+ start:18020 stop:18571 length:552 start_codon:yes stop_codon:yes gene_type:complete